MIISTMTRVSLSVSWVTPNNPIHRTSDKLRLPASGDFQR